MTTKARRQNVITQTRDQVTILFGAYEELLGLKSSWDNKVKAEIVDASGADPNAPGYNPGDFEGENVGLVKADFNQMFNTGMAALTAFVQSVDGKKFEDVRK